MTVDRFLRLQMGIERDAVAAGPEDLTVNLLSRVAGKEHDDRRDVGRVHGRPLDGTAGSETYLLGKVGRDGVGHTRGRAGHDRVAGDVVLGECRGTTIGEPENAGFGGSIIGLTWRPECCAGREVDNATTLLLAHECRSRTNSTEVALEVHSDHCVPLFLGHIEDHTVTDDTGAVDQNVDLAERIDRSLDQALSAFDCGDVVRVGHRLAARPLNLLHDLLSRGLVRPFTMDAAAEIVDHDLSPFPSHEEGDTAPDPPAGARNCCYLTVEFAHDYSSFLVKSAED